VKPGIQHGQPQMTIADLLGNPLPSTWSTRQTMDDVKIAWRKWLGMRVKIIDEYNRIPTRTQSALLTVMADNYAELYDQIYECPPAAWYLTANDDAGGGTYQVIEALRDRIDVVVKALHFNTRFSASCSSGSSRASAPRSWCRQRSSSFDAAENAPYRADLVGWIRVLFDRACAEYDRLGRDQADPVGEALATFDRGLEGLDEATVDERLAGLERRLREIEQGGKLYGHLFDDVLALKYLHQRYTNYRAWLRARGAAP
jgi:hypothetical protein